MLTATELDQIVEDAREASLLDLSDLALALDIDVNCYNRQCAECHELYNVTDCPIRALGLTETFKRVLQILNNYLENNPEKKTTISDEDFLKLLKGEL